jgi:type VII secretion protein EccB
MQNRKDLLQAHRLMTQRAALALLHAEPDPADRPLRRLNVGVFSGVLVAVLLTAAFGIWGFISPGGAQGLDAAGTLIIDSQSVTPYVWCQNGKLCPVVNYASARLALNTDTPTQRMVSQASLASYPRGPLIGIPGLPQPLPDPSMLVGAPWSVCVQAVTNPATLQQHTVTTLVGGHGVGGRAVPANSALLVQAAGSDWLIWDGQRLLIPTATQHNILTALGTGPATQTPETMPSAWLNAFPQGADFEPPVITGFGNPTSGPAGGSAHVGQVFTTTAAPGAPQQSYVMLPDGLAPITQTQAALLNAEPSQVPAASVTPSAVAGDLSKTSVPASGLPARIPTVVGYTDTTPLCVVYQSSATTAPSGPQVTVGGTVPTYAMATNGSGGVGQVALPPGSAALIGVVASSQPAAAAAAGQAPVVSSYFLLTGGLRYGLASPSVAGVLGYTLPRQQTLLPAGVADLIPQGPAFDPSKAEQQVTP